MYDQEQPYYLIGYSFGSLVAMEMAIQLQEQGSKVSTVYVLKMRNLFGSRFNIETIVNILQNG